VVYHIHKLFLSESEAKTLADKYRAGGLGYGDAKKLLLQTYMDHFAPMRAKRAELEKKPDVVREVAENGRKKASAMAQKTMGRVKKAVGL
jgi:tryptophanyl-tRNA synthetase